MRRFILFAVIVAFGAASRAQYTVTKVIGEVTNRTSGEKIVPGSKLRDDDLLSFSSEKDMLRVIVSGKGIYVIGPSPNSQKQQSILVEMLKSALKIKSREGYLSGRSDESEMIPAVLETESAVNNKHLVKEENRYLFDPAVYSISGGNRFFLQIEQEGSQPVIRPLKTSGDTLIVYASDFKTENEPSGNRYKLGFFSREKNSSESLSVIRPYFDASDEMETVMKLIVTNSPGATKEALKHACYAEIYESLGKPPAIRFNTTFENLSAGMASPK